nr:unnamed protein product [Callosobruchus analis]
MRNFLDMQKKRFNENGVAFFGIQEGDTRVLPETMAKFITSTFDVRITVADINYCYRMAATSTSSRADRIKRPRPVVVFFVNRWLRDRVFFAKSALKGSGLMICELLSISVLELYKQAKTIHVAHWETYKDLRNKVASAVKRERCPYFKTKLSNCQNSKAIYQMLMRLTNIL